MAKEQTLAGPGVIAAIATGMIDAALGIVRLSGEESWDILRPCLNPSLASPIPKKIVKRSFLDPETHEVMDEVLVVFYEKGKSFTGERMVEVFAHGGVANLTSILKVLFDQGARQALPGEFTQRAFLGGRIDLTQAIAIKTMASSGNPFALAQARKRLKGGFSKELDEIREILVKAIVDIEGEIEFEEGLFSPSAFKASLLEARARLKKLLEGPEGISDKLRLVIVGARNAGKSSLFNALLGMDRSIVTPIPGTTRDFLEASLRIGPFEAFLIDTAGLTEGTTDPIERLGIEKTKKLLQGATLAIHLIDISDPRAYSHGLPESSPNNLIVGSKKDLIPRSSILPKGFDGLVSVKTGEGLDTLRLCLQKRLETLESFSKQEVFALEGFEKDCLRAALSHVQEAFLGLESGFALEVVSQELMDAVSQIDRMSGKVLDFELMEGLFSTFCIGK